MLAEHPIDVMLTAPDVGSALLAWFVDPGGNSIGLLQFKDRPLA